jgi:hypothetical protein
VRDQYIKNLLGPKIGLCDSPHLIIIREHVIQVAQKLTRELTLKIAHHRPGEVVKVGCPWVAFRGAASPVNVGSHNKYHTPCPARAESPQWVWRVHS